MVFPDNIEGAFTALEDFSVHLLDQSLARGLSVQLAFLCDPRSARTAIVKA